MSCIHVDDVAGMALWAIGDSDVRGPLNAVMPQPLTNADFTRDVAHAVDRPAIIPAPAIPLRLFLGRMSSMLLDSSRVRPAVAEKGHYRYAFRDVRGALTEIAR
jgi:NAD dependent epimerase/dehydratase family enzyme